MNNNEQPNYILKFNESAWMPKNDAQSWVKKMLLIILAFGIIVSFIFKENIFSEISFYSKATLISLILGGTLFIKTKKKFHQKWK